MSRSGYTEDWDGDWGTINLYRAAVDRSIKGRRGQAFLRDLKAYLEEMPVKELGAYVWVEGDTACTLGVAMRARGLSAMIEGADPEDPNIPINVAHRLDIAESLARELVWLNDEGGVAHETDAARWLRVHDWICTMTGEPT